MNSVRLQPVIQSTVVFFLLVFVIVCRCTWGDVLFVLDCAVLLVDCKLVNGVL